MDLSQATADLFEPHRGTDFELHLPESSGSSAPLRLTLADIERFASQPWAPRPDPFTLTFIGPANPRLDQATYELHHAELGDLEIFLVPIGYSTGGALLYEAVFN